MVDELRRSDDESDGADSRSGADGVGGGGGCADGSSDPVYAGRGRVNRRACRGWRPLMNGLLEETNAIDEQRIEIG